jgi:hypothetical protein
VRVWCVCSRVCVVCVSVCGVCVCVVCVCGVRACVVCVRACVCGVCVRGVRVCVCVCGVSGVCVCVCVRVKLVGVVPKDIKLGLQYPEPLRTSVEATSRGLDRRCCKGEVSLANSERSSLLWVTPPSLFSSFCADKSQDVPRELDRKAKA